MGFLEIPWDICVYSEIVINSYSWGLNNNLLKLEYNNIYIQLCYKYNNNSTIIAMQLMAYNKREAVQLI